MKSGILLCATIALGIYSGAAHAAITANNSLNTSVPGITGNDWTVDTDTDWLSAAVLVELTTGTVHNPNSFAPGVETFFNAFPGDLDTFITANGNTPSVGGGVAPLNLVHRIHSDRMFWVSPGSAPAPTPTTSAPACRSARSSSPMTRPAPGSCSPTTPTATRSCSPAWSSTEPWSPNPRRWACWAWAGWWCYDVGGKCVSPTGVYGRS